MQGGPVALMQYVWFSFLLNVTHSVETERADRGKSAFKNFIFIRHEQYTPSIHWLAASHLASGCSKHEKPAFLQDVTFTKRRRNDSNPVPVQAVQLSAVYNCDRLTFICDEETASRRTECGKINGKFANFTSLMFYIFGAIVCDLLNLWLCQYTMPTSSLLEISEEMFIFFFFFFFLGGRMGWRGSVLHYIWAQWKDKIMSFLYHFLCRAEFLFGSCGTFISLCAHIEFMNHGGLYIEQQQQHQQNNM